MLHQLTNYLISKADYLNANMYGLVLKGGLKNDEKSIHSLFRIYLQYLNQKAAKTLQLIAALKWCVSLQQ
ncbi:MAG: hypothetical protein B7Y11_10455 [Sphingobacteriia bacterium 24-36-13]|jgi:hypothetical protein|nr:MAG: hypothetical protein B7Y66_01630 [Sphingobacteriia bacterium 35-36-14]OYZ53350.1 MAG: hypothetical protein B7Y11_10455 [Sphingobacteriia bacterium 24-36-13]OZA64760.1 MAG: hypothetical protein B7X68_06330 [Sphingobacteriia bacterium 39-36-14]